MQCPTDGTVLVMSERSGIEIDYCPTCRGVWLDRGELDKIIDRSLGQPAPAPPATQPAAPAPYPDARRDDRRYDDRYDPRYRKPKRKESWLSELFD
jgi:Zn-finger nucleic acid-binding protein